MKSLPSSFFVALLVSIAAGAHDGPHDQPMADHIHTNARLQWELQKDGTRSLLKFSIPGEALFGNEKVATTDVEKKRQQSLMKEFQDKAPSLIRFEPARECKWSNAENQLHTEKGHNEAEVKFVLNCKESLLSSKAFFSVHKAFPKILRVEVHAIAAPSQIRAMIDKDSGSLNFIRLR